MVKQGRSNTHFISVSSRVTTDSAYPFKAGDIVRVIIDDGRLVVERSDPKGNRSPRRTTRSEAVTPDIGEILTTDNHEWVQTLRMDRS